MLILGLKGLATKPSLSQSIHGWVRFRVLEFFLCPRILKALKSVGSVSSRECLDAPVILATFTAGRMGLVIV